VIRSRDRRLAAVVFTGFLALYLLTAPGRITGTDAWTRYEVAIGLVEHGRPILPGAADLGAHWVVRGADGAAYSYFGIGQSLAFAPLYVLGTAIMPASGRPTRDWPAVLASFLGSIVGALLAVVVFALARQVGYAARVALGVAAICGVGTTVWHATRDNSDQLPETLGLTASLTALLFGLARRSPRALAGAGALYGLALMTRLSAVFALPGILVLLATSGGTRRRRLLDASWLAAGLAPAVGFVLWYNRHRFGSVLASGYETKPLYWLGTPIHEGVAAFLVSPAAGLVWYVPLVLGLPLVVRWSRTSLSGGSLGLGVIALGYLLGYSQFAGLGMGVWNWGPQYLLPLMPLVALGWADALASRATLPRATRAVLAGLAGVSIAVQVLSASVSPARTGVLAMVARLPDGGGPSVIWQPAWSPLLNQGAHVLNAVRHLRHGTALESLPGSVEPERRLARDLGLNTFDWWWVRALYLGIRWAWVAPLILGAVAVWSARRAWSLAADPASS
jgi:hypothetical protein